MQLVAPLSGAMMPCMLPCDRRLLQAVVWGMWALEGSL